MIKRMYVIECDWCCYQEQYEASNLIDAADLAGNHDWIIYGKLSFCSDTHQHAYYDDKVSNER